MKWDASARTRALWALALVCCVAIALHFLLPGRPVSVLQVAIILGGVPLLWDIGRKLWRAYWGADVLAALSLLAAVFLGEYLTAVLLVLMLASGRALETYAMRRASSALGALAQRMPATAHRQSGEHVEDVALAEVNIGDTLVIYPHETAPVDGVVISGHGAMDESYLTGEPYRVAKAPGAAVLSGAINGDAVLVIRTERRATDSRYANITRVMQEAEQQRPALRRLGDQIGAIFTPLVLLVAGLTWWFTGDALRSLAVLVVATPCPLLIAIPVTIVSAISSAARRGILIKDPTVLERLPTCRTAIFDKTGTLTCGTPVLTDVDVAPPLSRATLVAMVASLERYSRHPLASAVLAAAQQEKVLTVEATEVSEIPGQGLVGVVDGHRWHVTHRKYLQQHAPDVLKALPAPTHGLECIILRDSVYAGTLRFHDAPRADSHWFIRHLAPEHHFKKIMLVSGDRESEVLYLAHLLGVTETLAGQTPEQKLAIVRAETALAPTLFVGDGINDAPALTSATVGIAFGQPTSVTIAASGAVIMESSLGKVDELLHLSLSMRRIALQSAVGGMALSLVGMGFAAAGLISPVVGAALQQGIDILAIANALRLIAAKPSRNGA